MRLPVNGWRDCCILVNTGAAPTVAPPKWHRRSLIAAGWMFSGDCFAANTCEDMMRSFKRALFVGVLSSLSFAYGAAAFDNGQYNDVPTNIRSWFKSVRSPNGIPCCDIADGHRTTWRGDKNGGYEVPIEGEWRPVPPEAIVYNAGNPTGEAIVWYVRQGSDTYYIRCFVPGDGV